MISKLLVALAAAFAPMLAPGQKVTGQFYGIGSVDRNGEHSQYLSEMVLTQQGNRVTGEYNYFFRSTYHTLKLEGTFNASSRQLSLKLIPVLNYKAIGYDGADCPMTGNFILLTSRAGTTLSGQFEPSDQYKYTCPAIVVKFKKEVLTPEQKKKKEEKQLHLLADNDDEAAAIEKEEIALLRREKETKNTAVKLPAAGSKAIAAQHRQPLYQPEGEADETLAHTAHGSGQHIEPHRAARHTAQTSSTTATLQKNIPPPNREALGTQQPGLQANHRSTNNTKATTPAGGNQQVPAIHTAATQKANLETYAAPGNNAAALAGNAAPDPALLNTLRDAELTAGLVKRDFDESPVIEVDCDTLHLALYDNGEVDDDTVALFHNRVIMVKDQRLSATAINVKVPIDTSVHEISMYAENLGRIPPNTAVCVITAGTDRYELVLSSTYMRNGTIRFKKRNNTALAAIND